MARFPPAAVSTARQWQSEKFHLSYRHGSATGSISLAFRDGDAVGADLEPPTTSHPPDYIPIGASQLKSVVDPLSALFLGAGSQADICNRTLRVYEGYLRIDVVLSLEKIGPVPGYAGDAVTCAGRIEPLAGFASSDHTYSYLREKGRLVLDMAPVPGTGVYTLLNASVQTSIGTFRLTAHRIAIE